MACTLQARPVQQCSRLPWSRAAHLTGVTGCAEAALLLLCCSTKRAGIPDLTHLRGEREAAAKPAAKVASKAAAK